MTIREFNEAIVNGQITEEVIEMAKANIAKDDAIKAKAAEKKAEKAAENAPLIAKALEMASDGVCARQLADACDLTIQKASSILRNMPELVGEDGSYNEKKCKVYHLA